MNVADKMHKKRQRLQSDMRGQGLIRSKGKVAVNLRRNAIAVGTGAFQVERFADVDILVMPAVGIAPAHTVALDTIRPDADIRDIAHSACGRAQHWRRAQKAPHICPRHG